MSGNFIKYEMIIIKDQIKLIFSKSIIKIIPHLLFYRLIHLYLLIKFYDFVKSIMHYLFFMMNKLLNLMDFFLKYFD